MFDGWGTHFQEEQQRRESFCDHHLGTTTHNVCLFSPQQHSEPQIEEKRISMERDWRLAIKIFCWTHHHEHTDDE